MRNPIGQVLLNQYRVEDYVASGGMGTVYRIWDIKRNVPLAMKVLHTELLSDTSAYKRFLREAKALKKLAHPNIVPFYGLHKIDDFAFLLEAFIDGPTLKTIFRRRDRKPFSPDEVLVYMKSICAVLGYAHVHGVVHCDIKPGNVMVDRGGQVYITDFGIARHAESTTTTLATAGTPAYMAPEQIRAEAVTPATDVYALGVLLFEMLTGKQPFQGDGGDSESAGGTADERLRFDHLHQPSPDPRDINPSLSEPLSQVVRKALAKDPESRYRNAQELYEALLAATGIRNEQVQDRVVLSHASTGSEEITPVQVIQPSKFNKPTMNVVRRIPIWGWILGGVIILGFFVIAFFRDGATPSIAALFPSKTPTLTATAPPTSTYTLPPTLTPSLTPVPSKTPTQTLTPTPSPTPVYEWLPEMVQEPLDAGKFSSLVIDDAGFIHIAYFQDNYDLTRYINNKSGKWQYIWDHGGLGTGYFLTLALDSAGNPNIAYNTEQVKDSRPWLYLWRYTSQGWVSYRNTEYYTKKTDISMVAGPDNTLHFSFQESELGQVVYAKFKNGAFQNQPLGYAHDNSQSFPIAVDSNGYPHLVYYAREGGLMYIRLEGESIIKEEIDNSSGTGLFAALAIDQDNIPHIAYYDSVQRALKYARRERSGWEITLIDQAGDVGQYPSMVIDKEGHIHVSYYDATKKDLKYAYGDEGGWNLMIVDTLGDVGKWNSIAITKSGLPVISYFEAENENLKLARAVPR